jgi:hypothetical protein
MMLGINPSTFPDARSAIRDPEQPRLSLDPAGAHSTSFHVSREPVRWAIAE